MNNLLINLDKFNYVKQEGTKKIFKWYTFMKMDDFWTLPDWNGQPDAWLVKVYSSDKPCETDVSNKPGSQSGL